MAFTFIATAEYNASSWTAATINVPTGTADWDIMFAILQSWLATIGTMTPPAWSTWTLLGTANPITQQYYRLYYRIANSEPASYTWTISTSTRYRGVIATYRDWFNTSDPIDVVSNTDYTTVNTTLRAASMNVSAVNSPLVFIWWFYQTTSVTSTKPSVPSTSWAEDYDVWNGTPDIWQTFCSMVWSWSWATGNMDATITSSAVTSKHAFAIALNPPSTANTSNFFMFM